MYMLLLLPGGAAHLLGTNIHSFRTVWRIFEGGVVLLWPQCFYCPVVRHLRICPYLMAHFDDMWRI